jgi:pimeloyl-ACP methyl ester carboxylesterase
MMITKFLLSMLATAAADTWTNYTVGGMDIQSVTGGNDTTDYDKVVVMLHGAGGNGSDWKAAYDQGWFNDTTGMKYVFPTSAMPNHTWYNSYNETGCNITDDCAYDIASIIDSA